MASAGHGFIASGIMPTICQYHYRSETIFPKWLALCTGIRRFNGQLYSGGTSLASYNHKIKSFQNERDTRGKAAASPFMEDDHGSSESKRNSRLGEFFDFVQHLTGLKGGPPRWFTPLESASRLDNSPLLLYLPGIDGTGAGLASQLKRLGKIFDIWCLHIPVEDRTPFTGLVNIIEATVKSEALRSVNRPIYLVGDSLGACLALAVAARNPDLDLMLILANPATSSVDALQIQPLVTFLEIMPDQVLLMHQHLLGLMAGDPLKFLKVDSEKSVLLLQELSKNLLSMSSHASVLADILPKRTLLWKLQMLKSASAFTNSCLHTVKARTLILVSEKDQLFPSKAEASRLYRALHSCEVRRFEDKGHFLFLEDDIDLVTLIKCASFYRRGRNLDYVADYLSPTYSEFINICKSNRLISDLTDPVMLSTLEDGKIIRGLAGIPSEGPVLFVGYHMLFGLELVPLITRIMIERNIHVRGIAHPYLFAKYKDGGSGGLEPSYYDMYRILGAVPVSGKILFQLLSRKSHILLYPGGAREALHRKGEEYKLFWPEQAEFIRMAARFGADIVPFGVVGEDDIAQVIFDYDDLMKIPYLRDQIKKGNDEIGRLRTSATGAIANQELHIPGIMPKIPGRIYYLFGKPIKTEGRKHELKDRDKSHDLYIEVKSEVERCISYLKKKREGDRYRNIISRLAYRTINGSSSEIPTFEP